MGTGVFESEKDVETLKEEIDKRLMEADMFWEQIRSNTPSDALEVVKCLKNTEEQQTPEVTSVDEFVFSTRKGDLIIRASQMPVMDILSPSTFTLTFRNSGTGQVEEIGVEKGNLISKPSEATRIANAFKDNPTRQKAKTETISNPANLNDLKSTLTQFSTLDETASYLNKVEDHVSSSFENQDQKEFKRTQDYINGINIIISKAKNKITEFNFDNTLAKAQMEIDDFSNQNEEYKQISIFLQDKTQFNLKNELTPKEAEKPVSQDTTKAVVKAAKGNTVTFGSR